MARAVIILSAFLVAALSADVPSSKRFGWKRDINYPVEADMDMEEMVEYHGYPIETHTVETEDGYLLTVHRIPYGIRNVNKDNRVPVLIVPGLFCSSKGFALLGPKKATAYVLAENGYDVWIGNVRGTTYSKKHKTIDPDADKEEYWNFSFNEIGLLDVPAMIDYILEKTSQDKLYYIGHSQGTSALFALAAEKPEYNEKIRLVSALAPIAFMSRMENEVLQILSKGKDFLNWIATAVSFYEVVPHWDIFTELGKQFCYDGAETQDLCINLLGAIGGQSVSQTNTTLLPVVLSMFPAGASVKQLVHYAQLIVSGKFRKYDYGLVLNLINYGNIEAPDYDLWQVSVPVALLYGASDTFTAAEDVAELAEKLPNVVLNHLVEDEDFAHFDFVLASDINTLVHDKLLEIMANN